LDEQSASCLAAAAALKKVATDYPENLYSEASPGEVDDSFSSLNSSNFRADWGGQAPSTSTLDALVKVLRTSALACPNVRSTADASGSVVAESAGSLRLKEVGFVGRSVSLNSLSLPAIDPTGTEALVAVANRTNRMNGGTGLLLLRLVDGHWRVVGQRRLTIG
jgi:hypothetical protein